MITAEKVYKDILNSLLSQKSRYDSPSVKKKIISGTPVCVTQKALTSPRLRRAALFCIAGKMPHPTFFGKITHFVEID